MASPNKLSANQIMGGVGWGYDSVPNNFSNARASSTIGDYYSIGVDLFSRLGGGGGGMIGVPCEGAKRPSGGRVWEGEYPPPTVGTFSKIRVYILKSNFRALTKNDFLGN